MPGIFDRLMPKGWRANFLFLAFTAIITVFAYSNVLHGDPQFDDEQYIFDDALLKSPHAFKGSNLFSLFLSGQRPVTAFTFALNYYFWGRDTYSYHLTNLSIHIINGILAYLFIYITLNMPAVREKYSGNAKWVAFLASLFFSIHPLQTGAVSYIVQRGEVLASMFYLFSMLFFALAANAGLLKKSACLVIFVACFVLGVGSKQIAVTIPLVALLYGLCFFEERGLWKRLVVPAIMLFAGLVISAYAILYIGKSSHAGFHIREFTVVEYLYTQFRVIFTYLRMLLLPVGQSIDHLYPVSRSFWETATIVSFTAIISLLSGAVMLYKRWRAASFFILWFFIILLPSSSIIPLKDVIFEHRLYLPSLAVYFILASSLVMFFKLLNDRWNRKAAIVVPLVSMMFVTNLLFAATYHRNSIWSTRLAMWRDVVRKYPKNARGHHNLGNCYFLKKDYKNALKSYLTSMNIAVANMELYYNVGLIFESMGMSGLARDFFAFFVKYSGGVYGDMAATIGARYGLNDNSPVPDIIQLKKRAVDAYYRYYGTDQ